MARRKAAPRRIPTATLPPSSTPIPDWPREIILDGSRLTADLIVIDGRDYVSITSRDGASTDYPLSSLQVVRPHIYKAVFG